MSVKVGQMYQTDPVVAFVILLTAALIGGMIAHRLRQPVILGYLVIGIAVGPHAIGLVGDVALIETAATMGVALLMFTLGLETSISQLRQVGRAGLWGGIAQILVTGIVGFAVGMGIFRWPVSQSILFGLIISLSSTAVGLKILMDRGELDSVHGRIMISILILQDVSVVVMMVITPLMGAELDGLPLALGIAVGEALLFIGLAIVSGLWLLPWLMGRVGGVRSRELFLLTILVMSLGAALATQIVGLSAVFGAFLIGLVLRESRFGHQALAEITPLRDIFATLFFVSLGMLLSPVFVIENLAAVLVVVAAVILIKVMVVFGIIRFFGYSSRLAILTGAGLFQIGEFSFILAQAGLNANLISGHFYSLILASAIITMLLTPLSFGLVSRLQPWLSRARADGGKEMPGHVTTTTSAPETAAAPAQVVLAGCGRIGQNIAQGLDAAGIPYIIIDIDPERISEASGSGLRHVYGDASNPHVLARVGLASAKTLVVTFPDPVAAVTTIRNALEINPNLKIVARAHRAREADILRSLDSVEVVSPEYEASLEFLKRVLIASGWKKLDTERMLREAEREKDLVEFGPDGG